MVSEKGSLWTGPFWLLRKETLPEAFNSPPLQLTESHCALSSYSVLELPEGASAPSYLGRSSGQDAGGTHGVALES